MTVAVYDLRSVVWEYWLIADEPIGLILGVLIVLCLIRQKVWAWPLGVFYVLVSITVLLEAKLYANLALHVLGFLPLNLYGWYVWIFGGEERDDLPVTRSSISLLCILAAICVVGGVALGYLFNTYTDAALPYWDNGLFMLSFAAMYLTAHKKLENWLVWVVVNVISVAIYVSQGLWLYGLLYFAYFFMAIWGFFEWRRSMTQREASSE